VRRGSAPKRAPGRPLYVVTSVAKYFIISNPKIIRKSNQLIFVLNLLMGDANNKHTPWTQRERERKRRGQKELYPVLNAN